MTPTSKPQGHRQGCSSSTLVFRDGIDAPSRPVNQSGATPGYQGAAQATPEGFRTFVAVCAFAGLRLGEVAGLHLDDVDFCGEPSRSDVESRARCWGRREPSLRRTNPARPSTCPTAWSHAVQARRDEHDFGRRAVAVPMVGEHADSALPMAATARGGRHGEPHPPRPAALVCLRLMAAGCDVAIVQHALGHSTPTVTLDTYSHL